MAYKGLMEGWDIEDDTHSNGCCCDDCEQVRDDLGDMQYEQYRFECDNE